VAGILVTIAAVAYLLGSIPAGYIAGRIAGVDIRKLGSGNLGATNVTRILGKRFGYPVFLIDFAKGLGAVLIALTIARGATRNAASIDLCAAMAAVFSVIGHSYPIWLRFEGGKGVATALGSFFGLNWIGAVVVGIVWLTVFQVTRYVSLASITAAAALPITIAILLALKQGQSPIVFYFALFLGGIVIFRHRSNLSRLWKGTEPRFNRK
jgi:acyl phosphate:glycerol-3-phosphate acyltransferase